MGHALALARDVVQQAIAADDKEPWAFLAQGMIAFATRDNVLAMAAISQVVPINPNSAFAHGQLGLAHVNGGRAANTIPCIDYAVRLSPHEAFLGEFRESGRLDAGKRAVETKGLLSTGCISPNDGFIIHSASSRVQAKHEGDGKCP